MMRMTREEAYLCMDGLERLIFEMFNSDCEVDVLTTYELAGANLKLIKEYNLERVTGKITTGIFRLKGG